MKKTIIILFSFISNIIYGQEVKWVDEQFDYAHSFSEGLALVRKKSENIFIYGFIDKTGKVVIPFEYSTAHSFSEGLALVEKFPTCGYIDKTGKVVIPFEYSTANSFSEGLALVRKKNKLGYIDKTGKVVIPLKYNEGHSFSEGLASVRKNNKWGFIDKTGKVVIPFEYDDIEYDDSFNDLIYSFSEGLACVKKNNRWGYIDKMGKVVIPFEYHKALAFSEGLASVSMYPKWGYIDKMGKVVIPFEYHKALAFSEGLASVAKLNEKFNDRWGFIDKMGKVVIPFEYVDAYSFSEGLASVAKLNEKFNDRWGYIDKMGKVVIPFEYYINTFTHSKIAGDCSFNEALAIIAKNGGWVIVKNPLLKKEEPTPLVVVPQPTIQKPIITWLSPAQEEIITTETQQKIKACISSETKPSEIKLTINGIPYATKDFSIVSVGNSDCQYSYEVNLNITTKNTPQNFVLSATNDGGTTISNRTITVQTNIEKLPKVYAMIVGIADYPETLHDLKYCADDAQKVYNFLRSPNGGNVPDSQIKYFTNSNATVETILQTTNRLFSQANSNDLIIFYFSGHGSVGYFEAYDGNIPHESLNNIFMGSNAERKLCVADACHSDSWGKSKKDLALKGKSLSPEEMTQLYYNSLTNSGTGLAIFMSCQANEDSIEDQNLKQGLFTYYYLEGLKGLADTDYNKIITLQELYDYVKTKVSTTASKYYMMLQNPKIKGAFDHDMPVGVVR